MNETQKKIYNQITDNIRNNVIERLESADVEENDLNYVIGYIDALVNNDIITRLDAYIILRTLCKENQL